MFLPESDKTIISSIKKVEPATFMEIFEDGVKSTKYWDLSYTSQPAEISYDDAENRLDELLTESVSLHLLSDVPLGLLLSGGVDSSLIAALMAKKLGVETHTYTAKFNHKFNESSLAAETAKKLGTIHKEFFIDVNEINKNIDDYMAIFDDLTTFDGGIISTSILAKYIRNEGIKVLLLGEGADEVFGGYSWFGLSQMPFSLLPKILRYSIYYYVISRNYSFNYFNYVNYWYKKSLPTVNTFNDIARKELQTQLPNHLLMKVDKATMSASIEARVPYLDHELVEFVYSLPKNFKLAGNIYNSKKPNEKRILRDVASRYLSQDVAFRKKRGFLLPMNDVLLSDREKVKSRLTDSSSLSKRILGAAFVDSLFDDSIFSLAKMQKEYFTWRLFILESWAKHYNLQ